MDASTHASPTSACSTSRPRGSTSTARVDRLYSCGSQPRGISLNSVAISRASPCCCPATTRKRRSRATVAGFRAALPGATIYVYDNNSRDRTREVAAAGRRDRPHRAPAGQGPCRPPHVRRHRRRRLRHGRRRPDLRSQGRAGDGRPAARRAARHGRRHPPARGEGRLSRRPRAREQAVHRPARPACSGAASATSSPATGSSRGAS